MNLGWGGGAQDILLDVATGQLWQYAGQESAAAVHAALGGRNYYISRTGMTGAGYVPDRLGLVKVDGYRVGVQSEPWIGPRKEWTGAATVVVAGWSFEVPFTYGSAQIPQEWPVIGFDHGRNEGPWFLSAHELPHMYRREFTLDEGEMKNLVLRSVKRSGAEVAEATFGYRMLKRDRGYRWPVRRLIEALNKPVLQFEWTEGVSPTAGNAFWNRLGLHPASDGLVYKISYGICRASYTREQLSSVEALQMAAPKNVRVLAPNVYVQGQFGSLTAIGLFAFDGEEYDYEITIDDWHAARAFGGNFDDVVTELEAGAREKRQQDLENRRRQAEWEAQREAEYRRALEANLDRPVSRSEIPSYLGVDMFGDRESVPVAEIATREDGRGLLEHVFQHRRYAAQEEARKLAETDREAWFRQMCETHGDVEVTVADSRSAGNCEVGTRQFRDRVFPGRESVKLAELVRHSSLPEVRRVIEWKLRQLGA